MNKTKVFRVRYEYDAEAKAWSAVSTSPRVASFGRTLIQAKAHVREAIELLLDLPDGVHLTDVGVSVCDRVAVPGIDSDAILSLNARRLQADELRAQVAADTSAIADRPVHRLGRLVHRLHRDATVAVDGRHQVRAPQRLADEPVVATGVIEYQGRQRDLVCS